jgi:hypothetical protein
MKKFAFYWILSLVLIIDAAAQNNSLLKLWYENPAKQ